MNKSMPCIVHCNVTEANLNQINVPKFAVIAVKLRRDCILLISFTLFRKQKMMSVLLIQAF